MSSGDVRVADRGVVPLMVAKETSQPEGRPRRVGNPSESRSVRTQSRVTRPSNLERVNEVATRSRQTRFTALLHHVDVEALKRAFKRIRRAAAAGVDGMTVEVYAEGLDERVQALCTRIHSGRYRPLPVRRVHIPKSDGGLRALGLVALEDKIVQGAVAEVLSAIYEADFLGCSYGFRPARSAHQALRQVHDAIMTERVNWVIDADIRKFFDSVDHEWMMRVLEHRIADPRVLRLIRQWLVAGVMDNGTYADTVEGTPQGSGISPLLANIYLHYVLDLWIRQWQRRHSSGRMRLVRYADDFLLTFERRIDAARILEALETRLAKFGSQLHPEKTRLIEYGRFAASNCEHRGKGRPETFSFLGFTHYCGITRDGRFISARKTEGRRLCRKLKELRAKMRRRMHRPVAEQHAWLSAVLRGHYAYYGITGNGRSISRFHYQVRSAWRYVMMRRGQRNRMTWTRFERLSLVFPLPLPRLVQNWRVPTTA